MEGINVKERVVGHRKLFLVAIIYFSSLCSCARAVTNSNDLNVLNGLKTAWGANTLKWTSGDPCANQWQGVICNNAPNPQVTQLILSSTGISGTLPPIIGNFSSLTDLELSFNPNLGGSLPNELGQLTTLLSLSIQSCAFIGVIPSTLGNLKNLSFLALNGNQLTGPIPSVLGSLTNIYWFDLSSNNLSSVLPVSTDKNTGGYGLDTLSTCMHMHLNNNSFTGNIPSALGSAQLKHVIHLLLDNNQLQGSIPPSLGNLSALEILSLSNNQLSGVIPEEISNIPNLQQILVANNQLSGTIPSFPASTGFYLVDFSNNPFDSQPFPAWLDNATNLQTLFIEQAHVTGALPAAVLGLPQLETLWARNNSLNGTLTIPDVVGSNLQLVSLQDNQINKIDQLNITTNLSAIDLQLVGNQVCIATNLVRPADACNTPMNTLQPWSSPLSVSNSCASVSCSGTTTLNLQNPGNCNCTDPFKLIIEIRQPTFSIITDDLMANLQGQLYPQLGLLSTQVWIFSAAFTSNGRVDVTVNFFSADELAPLDQTIATNITAALGGQKVILNNFSPYVVSSVFAFGTQPTSTKKVLGAGAIAGIVIGILAAVLVVALYAILQKRRADKLKARAQPFASWGGGGEDNGDAPVIQGAKWFSFSEVKKATQNFSDSNEIGVGGYGKVYKGVLASGELVAVKRAQEGSIQGALEFKTEIELLSRLHHKNLVSLVGYCYDQGEQMLVYEFMVNGTMREWLLGKMAYPLDWSKRLSIAVGSARGLLYLHELANPPVIHRDIKSSNILLDENHVAKVADFGLSKLAPDGADKLQMTTQVKGTLGYLDPEYYMTQQLSEKSDVYSFGVVLLELLTSRAPIEHGKYIVREVRTALDKGGMNALQPLLDPSTENVPSKDIERFLDLALYCVEERGADRPTMNEVVKELELLASNNRRILKEVDAIPDKPWPEEDVYADVELMEKGDRSFQYSGGYTPENVEPK